MIKLLIGEKGTGKTKKLINCVNAALDASIHTNTIHVAKLCNTYKIPLLIACTGHSKRELEKIKKTCVNIPCEICPNLSLGFSLVIDRRWLL